MARKLLQDKLGKMNLNGSNIELLDSRLTLGGQQFSNSLLSVPYGTTISDTLYFVYAKLSSSAVVLEVSDDIPSVYRSGIESKTKLVGAFLSGPTGSTFGSFVTIDGTPTSDWVQYNPGSQGLGTLASTTLQYQRIGSTLNLRGYLTTGTTTTAEGQLNLPAPLTIGSIGAATQVAGTYTRSATSVSGTGIVLATAGDAFFNFSPIDVRDAVNVDGLNPGQASASFASAERFSIKAAAPIAEWSNTPLKDL